jgi:hypothetical protein
MHEEGEWFKFDDERVTKESKETAIQQQYGTDEDAMATGGTLAQRMSRVSNAYMLVYVREGDRDMIRATVSDDDIAEHIRYKHEQEKVRARYTGWVCVLVWCIELYGLAFARRKTESGSRRRSRKQRVSTC